MVTLTTLADVAAHSSSLGSVAYTVHAALIPTHKESLKADIYSASSASIVAAFGVTDGVCLACFLTSSIMNLGHKLNSNHCSCQAQSKPVWMELTNVACTSCLLSKISSSSSSFWSSLSLHYCIGTIVTVIHKIAGTSVHYYHDYFYCYYYHCHHHCI